MGVLDDAIREHLDLKRQHGASDDEIARAEAEALGPARREIDEPGPGPAAPLRVQPMEDPAPPPELGARFEPGGPEGPDRPEGRDEAERPEEAETRVDHEPFGGTHAVHDIDEADDEPFGGTHAVHDIDEDTLPGPGRLSD